MTETIKKLRLIYGSDRAIAKAIGVPATTFSGWVRNGFGQRRQTQRSLVEYRLKQLLLHSEGGSNGREQPKDFIPGVRDPGGSDLEMRLGV